MKFILGLLILAVAGVLVLNRTRRRDAGREEPDWMPHDIRGFRLLPGQRACTEALRRQDQPLPPDDLPKLPLPGCPRKRCQCRFVPVPGRRVEQRRQEGERREQVRFDSDHPDRRSGRDRRRGNRDPWRVGKD